MSIGARPRRTSWTAPSSSRCVTVFRSSRRTSPALRGILADLSRRYRDTPMAGRTHLQQALPVTFGYKTAIWLAMFDRHAERLEQLKPRVLVGQFAGAAGTLASLGDKGFDVQQALARSLASAFRSRHGTSHATALPRS